MNFIENNEKNSGNYVEFIICRSPKKNYDELLRLERKTVEIFRKEGVGYDLFLLSNNSSWEGFTNISKTVVANQDEDVWVNMLSYKDRKHRDEYIAKMSNNKECQADYEKFTKLITPQSQIITGEFKTLN